MIDLLDQDAPWTEGHLDGRLEDLRQGGPVTSLVPKAVFRMGAPGPAVLMSLEPRLYPKKAPVHLHMSDTFRMALEGPLRVAHSTYGHGQFRLQQCGFFYGPEFWSDEVGTNQILIMADRRGAAGYCTNPERQAILDLDLEMTDELAGGYAQWPRTEPVHHVIANNFGATMRPGGYFDGGFDESASWPSLSDGTRLGVVALGDPDSGPLLLMWDRPAGAPVIPGFRTACDLLRFVVDGAIVFDGELELGRRGFRLQHEDSEVSSSAPGTAGCQELWFLHDRRAMTIGPTGSAFADSQILAEVAAQITAVIEDLPRTATGPAASDGPVPATLPAGDNSVGLCVELITTDDPWEPYYARVVDGSGASLAFTESYAAVGELRAAVEALRTEQLETPVIHDRVHDKWFFRLSSASAGVLMRSLPFGSEQAMWAAIEMIRTCIGDAPVRMLGARPVGAIGTST